MQLLKRTVSQQDSVRRLQVMPCKCARGSVCPRPQRWEACRAAREDRDRPNHPRGVAVSVTRQSRDGTDDAGPFTGVEHAPARR